MGEDSCLERATVTARTRTSDTRTGILEKPANGRSKLDAKYVGSRLRSGVLLEEKRLNVALVLKQNMAHVGSRGTIGTARGGHSAKTSFELRDILTRSLFSVVHDGAHHLRATGTRNAIEKKTRSAVSSARLKDTLKVDDFGVAFR